MLTPEQIANLPTDAKKEYLRAMLLHDEKKKDQAIRNDFSINLFDLFDI